MGIQNPSDPSQSPVVEGDGDRPAVKTASQAPGSIRGDKRPSVGRDPAAGLSAPGFKPLDEEVEKAVEDIKAQLEVPAAKPSN
jgi:hypothetical protein